MARALLALLFVPALAAAQTVRLDAIPESGQVVHRMEQGAPLATFTFTGVDAAPYVVEFRRLDRLDGPPDETHVYDADGNMVERRFADGTPMIYRPHNCVRTPGTCTYTTVFASGATRDYRRVNDRTGDGMLRSRLYILDEAGGATFKEQQSLAFFEDGLVRRMERRNDDGEVTWASTAERLWIGGAQ